MTTFLGIDPSLTGTGFALLTVENGEWSGKTWTAGRKGRRKESLWTRDRRIAEIVTELTYVDPWTVDYAGIEEPAHGVPGGSTWDRAGLWWRLTHRLLNHQVPVVQVGNTQRQKFAVGRGSSAKRKVTKAEVMAAARDMWPGIAVRDDNAADALVIASVVAALEGPPPPFELTGYRLSVLDAIRTSAAA